MGFKMRNQGLPGINNGNSKKTGGRASSAPFQQVAKYNLPHKGLNEEIIVRGPSPIEHVLPTRHGGETLREKRTEMLPTTIGTIKPTLDPQQKIPTALTQRRKRGKNKKSTEVDYNSAPILQPRSTTSSSRNVVDRMYNSGAVDGGPTQGLDSKLTYDSGTGNYTRTEVTSSPAFEQRDMNPKLVTPNKLDMSVPRVNHIPAITRNTSTTIQPKFKAKIHLRPDNKFIPSASSPKFTLPEVLQFGGKDLGKKPSGLPQKDDSILYGTKETHDGVDIYKTLKEVRDNISKERQSLIKNGATDKEIKNFDTYQNKRISELYKRG